VSIDAELTRRITQPPLVRIFDVDAEITATGDQMS
jgi:hypothetical protein